LLVWLLAAGVLFLVTPGPPAPVAESAEQTRAAERAAKIAFEQAQRWQHDYGDHNLRWEEAEGHLAIVIDDVGRELHHFERLHALRYRLTFSVLPGAVYAPGVQLRLASDHRRRREVMLHLPMQPTATEKMREGLEATEVFLLTSDGPEILRAKVRAALERVPMATAVNNHMGSALTRDRVAMEAVMDELAAQRRTFVDSRTIGDTVAAAAAEAAGIPTASREIFLDHDPSVAAIEAALQEAADLSRDHPVIAIAHPSDAVVEVLTRRLDALHAQGIGIFPVSDVVMPPSPGRAGAKERVAG
jgi:polysaccharide deacetylase 2 family uncharacterized protein YibQ